ncbi:MAG TPA: hypothetical protein VIL09_17800 [Microvirga sp.]|jgi:endonuclease YncB( thermonuclease family)
MSEFVRPGIQVHDTPTSAASNTAPHGAAPGAASDTASSNTAASVIERTRALIREAVTRAQPIPEAERALELIVEASVRARDEDGRLAVTVIDDDGHPRAAPGGAPMTVADLLGEMRRTRPTLFQSAEARTSQASAPAGLERATASAPPVPAAQVPEPAPAPRDWIRLDERPSPIGRLGSLKDISLGGRLPQIGHFGAAFRAGAGAIRGAVGRAREGVLRGMADRTRRGTENRSGRAPDAAPASHLPWRALAAGAVALALAVGLGTWAFVDHDGDPAAEPAVTGAVTSRNSGAGQQTAQAPSPAAQPTQAPAAVQPQAGGVLRGVPEVLDTTTMEVGGRVIRLFGVEWARGGAAEDLTRYIAGREVQCREASGDVYRCEINGQDLSRVVLFNGGGRATADATPELKAAEAHARAAKSGVWSR